MREPGRDLEVAPLHLGAVAHTDDLQALLEALGHALDHVRDERAAEPVQATVEALVVRALHADLLAVDDDLDPRVQPLRELAPRALHGDDTVVGDRDVDAGGDRDGLLADPAHAITRPPPGPRRRCPCARRRDRS